MDEKMNRTNDNDRQQPLDGSKSDPQKTEMEGLKQGGKEPVIHEDDKAKDEKGRKDD